MNKRHSQINQNKNKIHSKSHFISFHFANCIIKSITHLQFDGDEIAELQPAANEFQFKFETDDWDSPSAPTLSF